MILNLPVDLSNLSSQDDFVRYASQSIKQIITLINGKVSLSDNVDAKILSVTFNVANVSQRIAHTLNRVPVGYIPINLSANMVVYNGSQLNTTSLLYLKSSAIGVASILLF